MDARDILLGYDLRENWLTFGEMWDAAERSERFLWRQDIEKPLSVDSYIWPSVFDLVSGLEAGMDRMRPRSVGEPWRSRQIFGIGSASKRAILFDRDRASSRFLFDRRDFRLAKAGLGGGPPQV